MVKYESYFSDLDDIAGEEPSASLRAAILIFLATSVGRTGSGEGCERCMLREPGKAKYDVWI
jgi:hypothetical protein